VFAEVPIFLKQMTVFPR